MHSFDIAKRHLTSTTWTERSQSRADREPEGKQRPVTPDVLAKIADSEEIEQNAKIEPKPAQATTPVTVVTNGENASVSSQNVDIQKPPLVTTPVTGDPAAYAPAKDQTDEVARIKAVWRDLGIKDLDGVRARDGREPVREHLASLRRWESKWKSRDGSK